MKERVRISRLLPLALLCMASLASLAAKRPAAFNTVWDDFRDGFTVNTPDAKWTFFGAGPFVGDNGVETTSPHGLTVRSPGVNPQTGLPAFTLTVGQEGSAENPFGLPGGFDHVKWLAYMNHTASSGYPGFDAVDGNELSYTAWVGGRTFGTENHPFGADDVDDPDDDLRLASVAMNCIDLETFMVFDFFLTNKRIYAFYERLPFGRGPGNNYAAFSHQIPVAERRPGDEHRLEIAYDRTAGTVTWRIGGKDVFQVDHIGFRIDRQSLTIDHGGDEPASDLVLNQLWAGMGMFTLLDGSLPSDVALVRLSTAANFYFDPAVGSPVPQNFVDNTSDATSRLFGQGAELTIRRYGVSSLPRSR